MSFAKAGEIPSKSVVEYATIKVEIPHRVVPINLRNEHYGDEDLVKGLSVSPTGRLSYKRFTWTAKSCPKSLRRDWLNLFKNRPYRDYYRLAVSVERTAMAVTASKGKIRHSDQIASYLAGE